MSIFGFIIGMEGVITIGTCIVLTLLGAFVSRKYLGKSKGVEQLRRRIILFRINGAIALVVAFTFFIAVKFIPDLRKAGTILVPIGFSIVVLGIVCLGFAEVFRVMREILKERHTTDK